MLRLIIELVDFLFIGGLSPILGKTYRTRPDGGEPRIAQDRERLLMFAFILEHLYRNGDYHRQSSKHNGYQYNQLLGFDAGHHHHAKAHESQQNRGGKVVDEDEEPKDAYHDKAPLEGIGRNLSGLLGTELGQDKGQCDNGSQLGQFRRLYRHAKNIEPTAGIVHIRTENIDPKHEHERDGHQQQHQQLAPLIMQIVHDDHQSRTGQHKRNLPHGRAQEIAPPTGEETR